MGGDQGGRHVRAQREMVAHLIPLNEDLVDQVVVLQTRLYYTFGQNLEGLGDFTVYAVGASGSFELKVTKSRPSCHAVSDGATALDCAPSRSSATERMPSARTARKMGAGMAAQMAAAIGAADEQQSNVYINGNVVQLQHSRGQSDETVVVALSDGDCIRVGGVDKTAGFVFRLGSPKVNVQSLTQHAAALGLFGACLSRGKADPEAGGGSMGDRRAPDTRDL